MQLLVLIFSAMKIVLLKFKGSYCEGSGKSGYLSCRYIADRIAKHLCMVLRVEGEKGKYKILMAVGKDQIADEYLHRDNSANLTFLHGVALIPVVLYATAEN